MQLQHRGKSILIIAVIFLLAAGSLPRSVRSAPMNADSDRQKAELMDFVRNAFGYQQPAAAAVDDDVEGKSSNDDEDESKCICCQAELRGGDNGQDLARLPCGHCYHADW